MTERSRVARTLERVGLEPAAPVDCEDPAAILGTTDDRAALETLVTACVRALPFETVAITGPPGAPRPAGPRPDGHGRAPGVSLALPALYEKLVARGRGGFCFELNGLVGWLCARLGFTVDRVAGMVLPSTAGDTPSPANHHALVVHLAEPLLVDVGTAAPAPRCPVPLDGTPVSDRLGRTWRVGDSDRPDAPRRLVLETDHAAGGESEGEGEGEEGADTGPQTRYVLSTAPRDLAYFRATCDHLATAAESPFTGSPLVVRRTADGFRRLDADTLTVVSDGERTEEAVAPEAWVRVARERLALPVPEPGETGWATASSRTDPDPEAGAEDGDAVGAWGGQAQGDEPDHADHDPEDRDGDAVGAG